MKERKINYMLDSMSLLVITFIIMSLISVAGLALMHLSRNKKLQKSWFYFLAVWGIVIAWCNVQMIPGYMFEEIYLAAGLGALSAAALLVPLFWKKKNAFNISKWMVTSSVAVGMVDAFMF